MVRQERVKCQILIRGMNCGAGRMAAAMWRFRRRRVAGAARVVGHRRIGAGIPCRSVDFADRGDCRDGQIPGRERFALP